ncbi:Major Facilitator Superfamily protein [Actinobaculum suis]|uniref:MFS transporter n=1 Tax=Actinobaculum suis TaxID=1657 RepID=A0A1G7ENC2_9ACTO|nr:MFS transporter [Actinobaculum suis]MDY5153187.1 MFS transporter [Actinobaculum suis]SDE65183.1 Major Facilitator Superfamily protein [Actinobaculum suis]
MNNKKSGDVRLLSERADYRNWWIGDTSAEIGTQIASMAFTLLTYAVTRDVVIAGLVGAMRSLVNFVAMFYGGYVVDSRNQRTLLRLYGISLCVVYGSLTVLIVAGALNTALLFGFAALSGVVGGTFGSLTNAMLPQILHGSELTRGLSLNDTRDAAVGTVAAPVGAAFYGLASAVPFLINALCSLGLLWSAATIKTPLHGEPGAGEVDSRAGGRGDEGSAPEARDGGELADTAGGDVPDKSADPNDDAGKQQDSAPETFFIRLVRGATWVGKHPDIRAILLVLIVFNLGSAISITAVELQLQADNNPSWVIGITFSVFSMGAILGGMLSNRWQTILPGMRVVKAELFVQLVCLVVMATTRVWWIIAILFFFTNLLIIAMNSYLGAYQMLRTPRDILGRVSTVFRMGVGLAPILGSTLAGFALEYLGWSSTQLICAVITLIALVVAIAAPGLRGLPATREFDSVKQAE